MTPTDDAVLVRVAKSGDAAASTALMQRHGPRVRATCLRIVRDSALADDCTQDAFLQAWRNLARFDDRAQFSTWLYRIAANEALQTLRRRRPQELLVDEVPAPSGSAWQVPGPGIDRIDRARIRELVRRRLLEPPDSLRVAVVPRDVEEWSNEQIARALRLSVPAAKARIHRGRMQLRELLALDFPERT